MTRISVTAPILNRVVAVSFESRGDPTVMLGRLCSWITFKIHILIVVNAILEVSTVHTISCWRLSNGSRIIGLVLHWLSCGINTAERLSLRISHRSGISLLVVRVLHHHCQSFSWAVTHNIGLSNLVSLVIQRTYNTKWTIYQSTIFRILIFHEQTKRRMIL